MYPHDPPSLNKTANTIGWLNVLLSLGLGILGLLSVANFISWEPSLFAEAALGILFAFYALRLGRSFQSNLLTNLAYGSLLLNIAFLILNLTLRK